MVTPTLSQSNKNNPDVFLDLVDVQAIFTQIKNDEPWKKNVRVVLPLIKNATFRVMLVALHAGAILPPHQADGAITVQVVEGRIRFTARDKTVEIVRGQVVALLSNERHSVKALEDSALLITVARKKTAT